MPVILHFILIIFLFEKIEESYGDKNVNSPMLMNA